MWREWLTKLSRAHYDPVQSLPSGFEVSVRWKLSWNKSWRLLALHCKECQTWNYAYRSERLTFGREAVWAEVFEEWRGLTTPRPVAWKLLESISLPSHQWHDLTAPTRLCFVVYTNWIKMCGTQDKNVTVRDQASQKESGLLQKESSWSCLSGAQIWKLDWQRHVPRWCLISGLTILIRCIHQIVIEMKCVLEPLHSPVSRELCVQRWATHMTTLNDRRKVLAAPLMAAGWAEILAIFLVQVESTVIYFVCLRQRPIKIKQERQRPNELFRWPRARWSYWTKFEVEQRAQTCIFHVPALDNSIHPFASKCCYYRLTKLTQHDSFACRPNCIWKVFAWVWFVWTLLNERLKCWWPSLADWEWDVVWRDKDGEYWNCTCWNLSSAEPDTIWSLSWIGASQTLQV